MSLCSCVTVEVSKAILITDPLHVTFIFLLGNLMGTSFWL